jgi:homoserine dehydrogenase
MVTEATHGTDSPFVFVFAAPRNRNRPLVASEPGAGVRVAAAGVPGDVVRLSAA